MVDIDRSGNKQVNFLKTSKKVSIERIDCRLILIMFFISLFVFFLYPLAFAYDLKIRGHETNAIIGKDSISQRGFHTDRFGDTHVHFARSRTFSFNDTVIMHWVGCFAPRYINVPANVVVPIVYKDERIVIGTKRDSIWKLSTIDTPIEFVVLCNLVLFCTLFFPVLSFVMSSFFLARSNVMKLRTLQKKSLHVVCVYTFILGPLGIIVSVLAPIDDSPTNYSYQVLNDKNDKETSEYIEYQKDKCRCSKYVPRY